MSKALALLTKEVSCSKKSVLIISLLFSVSSFAENSDVKNSVVCLATIANWNAWVEKPNGGQSAFGNYIGNSGAIEKFVSANGKYLYHCDIKK